MNDGSSDATVLEAKNSVLAKAGTLRVVENGTNRGKGFSVKNGIMRSNGEYVIFTDADLSTPIEELDKLFMHKTDGYDAVIGSRGMRESDVIVHQPWYREGMGKIFNFFVKVFIISDFNDTQCGFKLFKGAVAREIADLMMIGGFAFDVEVLYLAKIKG